MNTPLDPNNARTGTRAVGSPPEQPMSATEARQGRTGFPVLKVLIAGLVLAVIAWGAAEMFGESTDAPTEQTATPPAGSTTPDAADAEPTADPSTAPAPAPTTGTAPAN